MEATANPTPLAILVSLETRSRNEAKGLPSWQDSSLYWEGFVFHVAGRQLLASMDEVVEILLHVPPVTRVPGAKRWVRGVVNLRGTLLPLMDLQQLMGGEAIAIDRHARILVVNSDGVTTGLLVAGVAGRKRFPRGELRPWAGGDAHIDAFVDGAAPGDKMDWPIFSLTKLLALPDYHTAAR